MSTDHPRTTTPAQAPAPLRSQPGFRTSIAALAALTAVCALVGFVWLPSVHPDFTAQGLWAAVCRAAGVPDRWSATPPPGAAAAPGTRVVLERSMVRASDPGAVGRGATLALNCTMCHGAQGMSASNSPNLAGQYPEVVIKQLHDYRNGHRRHAFMQGIAQQLSEDEIRDLAAYYASLPKARTGPTFYDDSAPALVRVGDPLRNVVPCIACHGGVDQKLGAPWIEGMPHDYLVAQLRAFRSGERRNDAQAQMRAVARSMTDAEIEAVAGFYARKAAAAGVQGH